MLESGQLSGYYGLRVRPGDERPVANDPIATSERRNVIKSCGWKRPRFTPFHSAHSGQYYASSRGVGGKHEAFPGAIVRRYQDFTFKAEYAYDHGMPQSVARFDHALSSFHLERLFLGRHKYYHFRVWYRDALSKYVQEMLLDPLTLSRPYLDRKAVEAVVWSHVKGERNYTTAIHKLLSLELIHRLFLGTS